MKFLLVTWYDNNNYGTSLQVYSLKKILENPNLVYPKNRNLSKNEVFLLKHIPNRRFNLKLKIKHATSIKFYQDKIKKIKDKDKMTNTDNIKIRKRKFNEFNDKNFIFANTNPAQSKKELIDIGKKFDVYISGSDQIWNPDSLDYTYLLYWVDKNKYKFSYGSSLSKSKIEKTDYKVYNKYLKSFNDISIRDSACRKQLSEIVEKKVTTVLDPVLLIGADGFSIKNNIKEKYIFTYFLGNNENHRKKAIELAKNSKNNLKSLINIDGANASSDKILERYALWDIDPIDFVNMISNSSFVLTDSFHATVLSILFHKDFYVFQKDANRPSQNSRIKELLELTKLSDRWMEDTSKATLSKIDEEKWRIADKRLNQARKESIDYLVSNIEKSRG